MADQEQTMSLFRQFHFFIILAVQNLLLYVLNFLKIYIIGVISLFCQLFERPVPVRALSSQASKTAIVTGGACGLGFHISKHLASLGATVVLACKFKQEAEEAIESIKEQTPEADVIFMELDLASFKSVKNFASKFLSTGKPLHILINNAGIMLVPWCKTEDGLESHLQVNHLSHALLTALLTSKMEASASDTCSSRVVNVSSVVHHGASLNPANFTDIPSGHFGYSPHLAYMNSKLAVLLHSLALSRRFAEAGSRVTVNAVHPGIVDTALYRHLHWTLARPMAMLRQIFFMSAERAALSVVYLAASSDMEGTSGRYFFNCRQVGSSAASKLPLLQEDVYNKTCALVQKWKS